MPCPPPPSMQVPSDMHAGRLFLLLCALCAVGAEPVYLGCSWRILGPFLSGDAIVTSQNVSVDFCEDFCLHKADGAPHLAAALRGGDECNCYNTLSVFTFPPGISCAKTCAGNPDQMCGGSRTLSVYQVSFPQAPPQPGTTELPATEADTQMPQGLPTGVPATGVPATMAPATGMPPTMMPMTDAAPTSPPTLAPEASNETVASETWLPVPHTAMPVPSGTAVPPTPQTWHTATPVLQTDTRSTPLPLPEASPTPALPNSEALGEQQAAAVALMAAVGGSLPGAASGTKMGFLALSTRAMLCPGDGPDHLDCTLSPLGLSMGHTAFREHNGGVVGALVLHFGLLGLCSIVAALLYLCYRRDMRQNHDLQYIMMQARFGWLIVPFTFLYGGTVLCAVTCVVYSTASYKVPAVVVLAVVGLGFPYYTFMVAHHCPEYQTYDSAHLTDRSSWWKVVLLGPAEWQDKDVEGSEAWSCLHRPVYNGYRYQMRYFLCVELMFMLVLACFTAWQPGSRHECWWRSLGMTSVAATFFLLLVVFRPFVALYENILEALIAGGETAMLVFTMVALDSGADSAADHWAAVVAGKLSYVATYCIIGKFLLDVGVFVSGVWRGRRSSDTGSMLLSFVGWFCFLGVRREMDVYFGRVDEEYELHTNHSYDDDVVESLLSSSPCSIGKERRVTIAPDADDGMPSPAKSPQGSFLTPRGEWSHAAPPVVRRDSVLVTSVMPSVTCSAYSMDFQLPEALRLASMSGDRQDHDYDHTPFATRRCSAMTMTPLVTPLPSRPHSIMLAATPEPSSTLL